MRPIPPTDVLRFPPGRRARLVLAVVLTFLGLAGGAQRAEAEFDVDVYSGSWNQLPDFTLLTPVATVVRPTIHVSAAVNEGLTDNFGLVFYKQIDVPTEADYEFYTRSDDGSRLYIDDVLIVDNDGLHGPTTVVNSVTLTPGLHDLRVEMFEKTGGQLIEAGYKTGNPTYEPIPPDGVLSYTSSDEHLVGSWGPVIQWPHIAISAANLPDGRIVSWSSTETNRFPSGPTFTHASVFDPTDASFLNADSNFHDMFCAGITTLEDGTILASGGNPSDRRTSAFDPDSLEWSPRADMIDRRWYATNVTMPDNRVFSSFGKDAGNRSELYDPATNTWTATPNANMQTLVSEQSAIQSAPNPTGALNHEWWSHLTVAPQGDIMMAGPTQTWHRFDPIGGAPNVVLGQMIGDSPRMYGNAVNYDAGKLMLIGGADRRADPPTTVDNVYLIDLNGPAPLLTQGAPMTFPRALSNSVVMPNGQVLVIGGNTVAKIFSDEGSVLPAEIYDPATDSWEVVDAISIPRNYHSTALLLKDGRVLAAGGGACGGCSANHLDGQIFSPPYLFESDDSPAVRPTLSVPADTVLNAGDDLVVTASADTASFSIVRLSGTTHHLNTDQRFLPLSHVDNGDGTFTVSFPANPNVLIVGNYWLFAVQADGTPSIGETINVQRAFVPPPEPEGGVYVSDLVWDSEVNGLGPAERDSANGGAAIADGGPLTLDGVIYDKGIGVHAFSEIDVRLDGQYDRFISRIGLDDERDGLCGDVSFEVDLDHVNVYASGSFIDTTLTEVVNLDVAGAQMLTLKVFDNGDGCGDSADWADARLIPTTFPGYRYYRFTPTQLRDDAGANSVQLSEFSLYQGATRTLAFAVTNPGGNNGSNDSAGRVNDENTNTKWRDTNRQPLVLDMGQNVEIDFYTFTTANDQDGRDPVRWLLEGSTDGATWDVLDDQTGADYPTPTARRTEIGQISISSLVPVTPLPSAPRLSTTLLVEDTGAGDRIWNVNPDNDTVSAMDDAGSVVAEIVVGDNPWSLAKQPGADRVFVTNKASAQVSVIDTVLLAVDHTFDLPHGTAPHGIVFSSDGLHYFVVLEATATLEKRLAADHSLVASLPLSGTPRHLSLTHDDSKLFVSNFITPPVPDEYTVTPNLGAGGGEVFTVDPAAMTLGTTIGLPHDGRSQSEVQGPGLPNYLGAPVVSFDGQFAYVPTKKDNIQTGLLRGMPGMTFESTVRANTSRIILSTELEDPLFRVDHDNSSVATGAALSGDDRYLFVTLETSRELAVYDTLNGFQLMRLPTGRAPQSVALSTDGSRAYVHNFLDRSVSRFDLTEMLQKNLPATNLLSPVPVVSVESLTPDVLLGKQHFYDAADDRLSLDNYMSCASCHKNGRDDGRTWDLGQFGEGLRKTISLKGKGDGHGLLHWTGNFDEVQDFEGQIRSLNLGLGFLTPAQFAAAGDPLGAAKAGMNADLDALAAYVLSLTETPTSPHRPSAGAMSATAQAGQIEFAQQGCLDCHSATQLTDSPLGLRHDIGTIDAASGLRLNAPLDGFDSPGLVGAWSTPPFLHDGEAQTLEAAITAHTAFASLPAGTVTELASFLREAESGDLGVFDDDDGDGTPNLTDGAPADPCVPEVFVGACAQDSDGDGESDFDETELADADADGTPDYLESSLADTDADGVTDEFDPANADACVPTAFVAACAQDTDGDGTSDFEEGETVDTDGDGTPDYLESSLDDADGDGTVDEEDAADADACLPDVFVGACAQDSDGDGATDFAEGEFTDSDGDGTPDYLESSLTDADADGTPDESDPGDGDTCVPQVFVAACALDSDGDGTSDFAEGQLTDSDGDGTPDYLESSLADADGDGTPDQADAADGDACAPQVFVAACAQDSDGDGASDFAEGQLTDSDGDGTPDYLESSLADADGDGTPDQADAADGDACAPQVFVAACAQDSDGDGTSDFDEGELTDSDGDGTPDYLESSVADTDSDGTPDQVDADDADTCVPQVFVASCAQDSDGDGTSDFDEGELADADGDGTPDYLESSVADADGDGTPDQADAADGDACAPQVFVAACAQDSDGDGASDFAEGELTDSDGDGTPDYLESSLADADSDGTPDQTDAADGDACAPQVFVAACAQDSDGDGTTDFAEGELTDSDGDGTPDYLESALADADGDGTPDQADAGDGDACVPQVFVAACAQDSDGDGVSDFAEGQLTDSDGDGTPDYLESSLADADGDGTPDQADAGDADTCVPQVFVAACAQDTDGDGATDFAEGELTDSDGDGTPDYLESSLADADSDGTPDQADAADGDACAPEVFVAACGQDTDGDGATDFAEGELTDSDGDGTPDYLESSLADADSDGTPDQADAADGDACAPQVFVAACAQDSDGDGATDFAEGELTDSDGDGTPDYLESSLADADADGTADQADAADGDACVPQVFVAACAQDSDGDGASDFAEGQLTDSDGDGTPDYLESSVADADSDGTADQADADDADTCIPQVFIAACAQDSDGDGATDFAEGELADADGDGTPDYLESSVADADSDGTADQVDADDADTCVPQVFIAACAQDSDGDGASDFAEGELTDTDGDGTPDYLESSLADADNDGTPDQADAADADACAPQVFVAACAQDSDGDGATDFAEGELTDSDGDGTPDYLESSLADADSDGTPDQADAADGDACAPQVFVAACAQDTDGDGVSDFAEGELADADGDGTPDYLESSLADADSDGTADQADADDADTCVPQVFIAACAQDSDGDGATDFAEGELADADGDGTPDYLESSVADADSDGTPDQTDADDVDTCVPQVFVAACGQDSDGDGLTDFFEGELADADGDGTPDYLESILADADADGVDDQTDPANDDACVPAAFVAACTQDTDGDGATDFAEGETTDTDGDGTPDYLESSIADADADGTVDQSDPADADTCVPEVFIAECTQDSDGDGATDFAEGETADADGDGDPDYLESSIADADGDGTVDQSDPANDDGCLPEVFVSVCSYDSDGDGATDFEETELADTDGDGTPDYLESSVADADFDGVMDQFDPADGNDCVPNPGACAHAVPVAGPVGQWIAAVMLMLVGVGLIGRRERPAKR